MKLAPRIDTTNVAGTNAGEDERDPLCSARKTTRPAARTDSRPTRVQHDAGRVVEHEFPVQRRVTRLGQTFSMAIAGQVIN